jgi:beta-lactamase class A
MRENQACRCRCCAQSDNTAGNLILDSFGGPAGLTAWLREIGDPATRLDRRETALNEARAGDPRDTTTPAAMVRTMQKILLGSALSEASRRQLADWLVANRTGDERIRAGVPRDWRVGDKTGTGNNGTANDVAILWPPGRAPLLLAVYLTGSRARPEARNAAIAEVARAMATAYV